MLLLYIAGLLAAFWIGFFLAAILANERRAEDLEDMMKRIEDIKKRSGLYTDKTGQNWLTWDDSDTYMNNKVKASSIYGEMKDNEEKD